MPSRIMKLAPDGVGATAVRDAFSALRAQLAIPTQFSTQAQLDAQAAADRVFAVVQDESRRDLKDVPFVTIDPPGSMDLDQALHLSRDGDGYLVRYAIADLGAFVIPGSALDREVHERGTTLYGPDLRTPLHPPVLSEAAASLLPGQVRPAAVWHIRLDRDGEITQAAVERAVVCSRARLDYGQVQRHLDLADPDPDPGAGPDLGADPDLADPGPDPGDSRAGAGMDPLAGLDRQIVDSLALLRTVGELRIARERARGGVSLAIPEQEIVATPDGGWDVELRTTCPAENWNAQISLLTGIAAASLMRTGGVGVLRTLPPADERDVAMLRRTARALGITWRRDQTYADLLPTLTSSNTRHAAFMNEAAALFRGAAYVAFTDPPPAAAVHAAIAAEYAHVTAPLRRLVDRYGTEVCLALSAGVPVPQWVLTALPTLPRTMAQTGQRAGSYDKGNLDIVEAALLESRVGEVFDAVVIDIDGSHRPPHPPARTRGQIQLTAPAVRARAQGFLPLGDPVKATLDVASVADRTVQFSVDGPV